MAVAPIDMRRSFDGLCAAVIESLGGNPLAGDLYLFRGKRADQTTFSIPITNRSS